MKKLFMLFAFMGLVSVASVSAQSCSKSKANSSTTCTVAATKAASLDASIEKRVCEKSGKVSFVRKNVCSTSGKTTYTNVEYNTETKKFVNVSPTHTSGKAAGKASTSCSAKAKATSGKTSCCTKGAKGASAVKKTSAAKAIKTSN